MTQVDPCLQCLFVSVNIFFMIVGGLIVVVSLAQLSPSLDDLHGGSDVEAETTSPVVLYIAGSVAMVIAVLGVYGARMKNLLALIVFLACMVIGCLLMLRAGVLAAVARPQLQSLEEERWRSFLPLDQASDDIKNQAAALQTSLHCCGLFSHDDWEQNIPDSCLCSQQEALQDKCQAVDYSNFLLNLFWQKKSVLRQTCFSLIMDSVTTKADIILGSVVTLFVLALLGSLLSSLMIYQTFDASDQPNTLLPVMFVDRPPAYQHLCNLSE